MICIATERKDLAMVLAQALAEQNAEVVVADPTDPHFLSHFYLPNLTAIVSDDHFPNLPPEAAADVLNAIGRRIPVIVLQQSSGEFDEKPPSSLVDDRVTLIPADNAAAILSSLNLFGAISHQHIKPHCEAIPYYNPHIPSTMLEKDGALGILTIDASGLSKVGLEYGTDVYAHVKSFFNNLLYELWGGEGSFRDRDIICRKSMASHVYYVFLHRSRGTGSLPLPGALEKAADRIATSIQNSLWNELSLAPEKRRLPECVKDLPLIGVGFFGIMNNLCLDPHEIIENGLESCRQTAQAQLHRLKDRQRELMQTLIVAPDMLYSHFQAVFHLGSLTEAQYQSSKAQSSIAPLMPLLYGFEALVRVDKDAVNKKIAAHGVLDLDPKYLRPDVLFAMAKSTKVALELDQACMVLAAKYSKNLPGVLMVNILPRNFYYIGRLIDSFKERDQVIFEISESETISNPELMVKAKELLAKNNMGIAADDFGKGYASLERILSITPDIIKFDRSMIQDIHEDSVKQAYVRGLVDAAKIINTLILAEGVEKWEEAKVLQEMGINLIQGFLLHRPQSATEIEKQLTAKPLKLISAA